MLAHVNPLGFLEAPDARSVSHLIGETQELVDHLGLSLANLRPAEEALSAAKALYDAQAYATAAAQAERAAELAVSLNDRFTVYMEAWRGLQACMEELQMLGFPTKPLEIALSAADKETVHQVEEDGALVPNYVGATALLAQATQGARTLVAHARDSSREIFLATLAIEAVSQSPSPAVPSWLVGRLERMAELATRELASGRLAAASKIAREARSRADAAIAGATRVWEILDLVPGILQGLGTERGAAGGIGKELESTRDALSRGALDWTNAQAAARRLSDEVAAFARQYPRARRLVERAERVYARLREDGYESEEVSAALGGARMALEAGDWDGVREKVGFASDSFLHVRKDRETLAHALSEIDERVAVLKDCRLSMIPEVQAVLARVREELRTFQLAGAGEDLMRASALMLEATRSGS